MNGGKVPMITSNDIMQRADDTWDVHYVIDAHFEITDKAAPGDNEGKFKDIFRRRIEKLKFYSQPYFGCREFPVHFRQWAETVPTSGETKDLDYTLWYGLRRS